VTTSNTNHSGKKPVAIIESAAEALQQKLYNGEKPRNLGISVKHNGKAYPYVAVTKQVAVCEHCFPDYCLTGETN
jgi:hypothetical protein